MLAEVDKLIKDQTDHPQAVLKLSMYDNVLSHIIAILIGQEHVSRRTQLCNNGVIVLLGAEIHHSLNDAAPILMVGKHHDLAPECVHHEIEVPPVQKTDDLLDDMVTILVRHDSQRLRLQLLDHLELLVDKDVL